MTEGLYARPSTASEPNLFLAASSMDSRRAKRWFDAQMKRARQDGAFSTVAKLTPELAELLSANNGRNRKISESKAREYAADIENGDWALNGEPVIVSVTGELNDGQHRCRAVILAGRPIDVFMVFGVSRESRTTVDQGIKRTVAHILGMSGYSDPNNLATAARIAWQYETHGTVSRNAPERRPTTAKLEQFVVDNPRLRDALTFGRQAYKSKVARIGCYAGLHFILENVDAEAVTEFSAILTEGIGYKGKSDPLYVLRKRLVEGFGQLSETEIAVFTIKAWNAWRAGETIRLLKMTDGEQFPVAK